MTNIQAILGGSIATPVSSSPLVKQASGFPDALNSKLKVPSNLNGIFQEASQKYQVPATLLKAVAKAESNFKPSAVSKAGAQGVMQLMPATAKELGVSNPFDARENIMGGAKYLGQMLNKYDGNTKLALAAYNAGSNNVDKYGGIPPFKETQNYVVKVMDYAGSDMANIPNQTIPQYSSFTNSNISNNSVSNDSTAYYQNILQNILNFDDFTSDDYILFLELLKNNLQTPGMDSASDLSDSLYQGMLFNNRVQTLY